MNVIRRFSALFFSISFLMAGEALPQSPEALVAAYQKAVEAGDEATVMALHEWDMENPKVAAIREQSVRRMIQYRKGAQYFLQAWNANDDVPFVMNGHKVELLVKPEGGLKIGDATGGIVEPYARVKGGYKLIGQRWTDLKWTGPTDTMLTFKVGAKFPVTEDGSLKLVLRYSASGIILERPINMKDARDVGHFGGWGQRVEEVIVVENKGPGRIFTIKRNDDQELIFEGKIPAGITGSVYKAEK